MAELLTGDQAVRIALAELSALRASGVLPDEFEGAAITSEGTLVHDLNGSPLYRRIPLVRGSQQFAYADIAVNPAMGTTFLSASLGQWSTTSVVRAAKEALERRRSAPRYTRWRLVAYSYPKLAVQFLRGSQEVAMLELESWRRVPPSPEELAPEPGDFQRWSLLERLGKAASRRESRFATHVQHVERWIARQARRRPAVRAALRTGRQRKAIISSLLFPWPLPWFSDMRELHYSPRQTDHHVCYELRGQETSVWCVDASCQMLLDFYRYNVTQDQLAVPLGLGTKTSPNGLPYGQEHKVVDTLQSETNNALTAAMFPVVDYNRFKSEIKANRPLISFIPGHSRTVAGYWTLRLPWLVQFRGLLVFDPWPPNVGVITRWENFDAMTYRHTFTAHVL
jgi:hypothetical protein